MAASDTKDFFHKSELNFDSDVCAFCSSKFTKANPCVTADVSRLERLFKACEIRNDFNGKRILRNASEIINGKLPLCYHRNCRATYQSSYHHSFVLKENEFHQIENSDKSNAKKNITRSNCKTFDWKSCCFICTEKCEQIRDNSRLSRSWSMVESAVDGNQDNVYSRVYKAAERKNDKPMLHRLNNVSNCDLVAVEARYHRKKACLISYLSPSKGFEKAETQETRASCYKTIAKQLKAEFEIDIMENKQVYTLSVLKKRFLEIAKDDGLESADCYQSKRFKLLLSSIWPELSFIYQNGASDLVCSCTLTVGDALKAAEKSEKLRRKSTEEDEELVLPDETDESIVHRAVGILRKKICETNEKLEHEYYAVDEISLQSQKMYVDPLLHKAVYWLSDSKGYLNASAPPDDLLDPKLISVACDITTLVTTVFSPKHLGLGVHLFNEFGSRHLIEEMNSMGYCISYNELRQFLSSAAYHISNNCVKTPSGGLVPDSIIPRDKGGKLIVASGDNWDHNEKTVDGKQTTHAMTSILVSPKSSEKHTKQRLPRVKEKTFDSRCMPGGSLCSIIPYRKPISRPNPEFDPPVDVSEVKPIASKVVSEARLKELLYNFGRCSVFCDDLSEPKTISPWSVFHARSQRTTEKAVSNVAFNPIIMAKPTDHSTVYTTLLRMKECVNALGQEHVPVFFDMALLSKALEIIWARKEELSGVIAFEGGMHLLMSIFAGIGHLYGNIGLRQLLIDSDLYAAGTVSMIMTGKDFDRAMTAYKLIDETLQIRFLKNFEVWCIENNKDIPDDFVCTLNQLRNESDNVELSETSEKLCKQIEEHICPLLNEFRNEGRLQSPTFRLWDDYLTRVSLPLKLFIASTRTGNWDLNKYAKVSLLPLLFASNRSTYSRYMVIEALQMNRLPADIEKGFSDGLFTAKLSEGKFNNVWIDYTLETTENKALKGSGGIIGLTLKENALARWFLSRPVSSHYSMTFHDNLSKKFNNETSSTYRGDKKAKRELVDNSVKKLTSMFDGNFIDPFDLKNNPSSLVNFATAEHVPKETEKSMLYCLDAGRDMLEKFITERLIVKDGKTSPEKSFYDPLPRSKVKPTTQERNICTNRHTTKIGNDVMFQRLLAVNAYKQVPSERVFAFENTTVPLSIFSEDGLMLSGKKSDFMEKLEHLLDCKMTNIDGADCIIYDAMAVVQILTASHPQTTFKDMAQMFLKYVLMKSRSEVAAKEIHIVFDRYIENSLKGQKRQKRGDSQVSKKVHVQGNMQIPKDWKGFLSKGENKDSLICFYTGYMKENAQTELKASEKLFVSGGEGNKTILITVDACKEIPDLFSNQEEADTRIILHAVYACDRGANIVVVNSPDTDVLVLLLHHKQKFAASKIYLFTGRVGLHTDLKRYIPVHKLFDVLTEEQKNILLSVYCITGCDTCSFFYGKGKKQSSRCSFRRLINFKIFGILDLISKKIIRCILMHAGSLQQSYMVLRI